jgi:hypothetical protein
MRLVKRIAVVLGLVVLPQLILPPAGGALLSLLIWLVLQAIGLLRIVSL